MYETSPYHIYARRRTGKTWAQSVELPKAPSTFQFEPLPETDRARLAAALAELKPSLTPGSDGPLHGSASAAPSSLACRFTAWAIMLG